MPSITGITSNCELGFGSIFTATIGKGIVWEFCLESNPTFAETFSPKTSVLKKEDLPASIVLG